ncbi:kinase-like protein [Agrocybe pediades]|nr:kinase-like protein [Agrocybe pediades]
MLKETHLAGVVDEGIGPNGEQVAIKRELASDKVTRPILEHEYHIYKALAGAECILDAKAYGRESRFNVMVMDLLGPSLNDRFRDCGKRFSLRTTAILGLGMLDAVEHIHTRGFIHRDIKPDNFLLGLGAKAHTIHPVDFGLARRWRRVIPGSLASSSRLGDDAGVIGTLPYASLHAHLGLEQTRRDDLHALTYTLLLFARGDLPWDHIRGGTRKHCARRILEKKRSWPAARLCRGLPSELQEFADYCFGLEVNETPNYSLLRSKLTTLAREGWNTTPKFEWEQPGWKGRILVLIESIRV